MLFELATQRPRFLTLLLSLQGMPYHRLTLNVFIDTIHGKDYRRAEWRA